MSGSVFESYVAALQHEQADVPDDATRVGVVRKPTRWFHGVVDENVPALGPPAELLEDIQDRKAALEAEGVPDAEAHNRAMAEAEYDARYAEHLDTDPDARTAADDLQERLAGGEDIVLVCYENTDEKRCHRIPLRARLQASLAER